MIRLNDTSKSMYKLLNLFKRKKLHCESLFVAYYILHKNTSSLSSRSKISTRKFIDIYLISNSLRVYSKLVYVCVIFSFYIEKKKRNSDEIK